VGSCQENRQRTYEGTQRLNHENRRLGEENEEGVSLLQTHRRKIDRGKTQSKNSRKPSKKERIKTKIRMNSNIVMFDFML